MERFENQVDRAVAANPEIEELVRRLESEQDEDAEIDAGEMPSGDAIARDFQRFLRQRATTPTTEPRGAAGSAAQASRRRADQAVVAPGADLVRGARLEVLAARSRRRPRARCARPARRRRARRHRDPLVGEHVPVAAELGVDLPGLAGAEPVERDLDVAGELRARARVAGLVVDQLVAAVGEAVDAVDPPAQLVRADREREAALEPDRLGLRARVALLVAGERGDGAVAVLKLVVGGAEARAAPARLEQAEQAVEAARARPASGSLRPAARASPRSGSARAPGGSGSRSAG